jgi:hypothetical protein
MPHVCTVVDIFNHPDANRHTYALTLCLKHVKSVAGYKDIEYHYPELRILVNILILKEVVTDFVTNSLFKNKDIKALILEKISL